MGTIWELDFYSRPIVEENGKKTWEVVITESPQTINRDVDSLFRYAEFCASTSVNSLFLKDALTKAMNQAGVTPQKVRFFRRQMNNMITKACEDLGIPAAPSRRTYTLEQVLAERSQKVYPQQPGYNPDAATSPSVQYQPLTPIPLPDAIRGDKGDRWAFVSLTAADFAEMKEWDIGFGEAFPLSLTAVTPETRIPGLIIFSKRALPLAGWMSGLEMVALQFDQGVSPCLRLETGFNDNWILADLTPPLLPEAQGFAAAKRHSDGVHFIAVQDSPESESFAGFWLLKDAG